VARVHAQNVSGRHWCWPCSIHCNPCASVKCACITSLISNSVMENRCLSVNPMHCTPHQTGSCMRHWSPCFSICYANVDGHTHTVPTALINIGERSSSTKHNQSLLASYRYSLLTRSRLPILPSLRLSPQICLLSFGKTIPACIPVDSCLLYLLASPSAPMSCKPYNPAFSFHSRKP
jgi:hypothetical protein